MLAMKWRNCTESQDSNAVLMLVMLCTSAELWEGAFGRFLRETASNAREETKVRQREWGLGERSQVTVHMSGVILLSDSVRLGHRDRCQPRQIGRN